MVSVEKWKRHFRSMAHKAFPEEDMYIVNQTGRGLGRNAFNRTTYKVRTPESTGPNPPLNIVSPVAQSLEQAKALVKSEPIKKRYTRKKNRKTRGRSTGRIVKKPKKKKKKKTTKKGQKKRKHK